MSTIDYARAKREAPALKRALTRAQKSGNPVWVLEACRKAVKAWNAWGAWPDNWHTWNIALSDAAFAAARQGIPNFPIHLDEI